MYSRKVKILSGKKKSKSPNQPGSNWGPRIALIEKEKALLLNDPNYVKLRDKSSGIYGSNARKLHHPPYIRHPEPPYVKGVKKLSISSGNSQSSSSAASNNYIYNYARKSSSSDNSNCPQSFYMNKAALYGSSYFLGSGNSDESPVTLSTAATTLSQPLTLIIPPARTEVDEFEDSNYNAVDSFPSTKTYKSSDNEESGDEKSDNGCKTSDSPMKFQNNEGILKLSTTKALLHYIEEQSNEETDSQQKTSDRKPGSSKIKDAHRQLMSRNLLSGNTKLEMPSKQLHGCHNDVSMGSTISSLAQGITMVYVPMESLPPDKSAAVLNTAPDYDQDASDLIASDSNNCVPTTISKTNDARRPPISPSGLNKDVDPDNDSLLESFDSIMFKPRDGVESQVQEANFSPGAISFYSDSLSSVSACSPNFIKVNATVESVDGVVRVSPSESKDITKTETHTPSTNLDGQRKIAHPRTPPPLPPKSVNMIKSTVRDAVATTNHSDNNGVCNVKVNNSQNLNYSDEEKTKTLKTAVANLDNIISNVDKSQKSKKVTLTLPNEGSRFGADAAFNDNDNEKNPRTAEESSFVFSGNVARNDTDTEVDMYSSTFLTCGHVLKDDDYSTLSSVNSPRIIDDHQYDEMVEQNSPKTETPLTDNDIKEKHRSVLQQLKELSLLIGAENYETNDKIFKEIRNKKEASNKLKTFRLHSDDSTRKISDATDNSADSGKGSGSSSGASGSSPKSFFSSPESSNENNATKTNPQDSVNSPSCAFRSDCSECLMYGKPPNGFRKPSNCKELCSNYDNTKTKSYRRNASTKNSVSKILRRKSSKVPKSIKNKRKSSVVLDYCECSGCCEELSACDSGCQVKVSSSFSNDNQRKISSSSSSSGKSSVKLSRSVAFRSSIRPKPSPHTSEASSNGLFTIEETEESATIDKSNGKYLNCQKDGLCNKARSEKSDSRPKSTSGSSRARGSHWHPDCWLAADPMLGWSDLESLYSLNLKNNQVPMYVEGECWTCWQEIAEIKKNSENPNGTVDRTKRMFIWLNKRPKEFQAPWWQAKKQASIRWIMTKALAHVPKEYLIDPFRESHKSKPTKYKLKDEVIKGLVSGKLYTLCLANLYQTTLERCRLPPHGLTHWDIIKILSRRGVYVAQPSDMKLTEGTLRQKPIRIAAHIALIEAIMTLYSKEILAREKIVSTLHSLGCTIRPDSSSPEKLVIAWINAAVMTVKNYIVSTRTHQLSADKQNRWLQLPEVDEIRDLCDGVGVCSLLAIYCSNDLKVSDIYVPEPGETLTIYDSISNHGIIQRLCEELFPETIYHLHITDWVYIHGYMKQNILCFLVDLFMNLEVNPVTRVNRLTHIPIRVELSQN